MDERILLLGASAESLPKAKRIGARLVCGTLLIAFLLLLQSLYPWQQSSDARISWFPCPDSDVTLCAFFDVPLDHLNPSKVNQVSLALRKLPATCSSSEFKGSLIINPGGPGGSGTEAVAREGSDISDIVSGRYDVISFDSRGINLSSPALDCFPSENLATLHQRNIESLGLLYENTPSQNLNTSSIPTSSSELAWAAKLDAYSQALDATCKENGNERILTHMSTAIAARDMKALLSALGEEETGLNYWGFSYGTVLGATFAGMFPELVNRMVLDGVSDPEFYTNNFWDWGRAAMSGTHTTLDGFVNSCVEAGPERCALATSKQSPAQLHTRISELRKTLHLHPLAVPSSSSHLGSGIITTSAVQHVIFRSLYSPRRWPKLALALFDAENGNGTGLFEILNGGNTQLGALDPKDNVFHRVMDYTGSGLLHHAVACSETDPAALEDKSLESLIGYMREMGQLSISGEAWALWIAQCRRWSFRAKEVYRGPWKGIKPKFPILFVGVTGDPVTPLSATRKLAEGFGNQSASLLVQNGFGHCSYAHPSKCTRASIKGYFLDGVLPKWGETCDSDPGLLFPDKG